MFNNLDISREFNSIGDSTLLDRYTNSADAGLQAYSNTSQLEECPRKKQGIRIIKTSIQQISPNFSELEIDQLVLIIAKNLILKKLEHIKEIDFNDQISSQEKQDELIALANAMAEKNPQILAQNIQSFAIDSKSPQGQKALIALAFAVAEKDPYSLSKNIANFDIDATSKEGQEALVKLAGMVAEKDSYSLIYNIANFGINIDSPEGQEALINLAEVVVKDSPTEFLQEIKNFKINSSSLRGQEALINLAFKIVDRLNNQNIYKLAENIQNFGIDASNENGQAALLMILAKISQINAQCISHTIKNFNINSQGPKAHEVLFALALKLVEIDPWNLCRNFQNFGIQGTLEGQSVLMAGITKMVELSQYQFLNMIQHFCLKDQYITKEIIALANKLTETLDDEFLPLFAKKIPYFGIKVDSSQGQIDMLDLAMKVAEKNPEAFVEHVQHFGIITDTPQGQEALIAVATKVAEKHPKYLILNIQKFGIESDSPQSQAALIKLANIVVKTQPDYLVEHLKDFSIQSSSADGKSALIDLAKIIGCQYPEKLVLYFSKFNLEWNTEEDLNKLKEIIEIILRSSQNSMLVKDILPSLGLISKNPLHKKILIDIGYLSLKPFMCNDEFEQIRKLKIAEAIFNVSNTCLQMQLFAQLMALTKNEEMRKRFLWLVSSSTQVLSKGQIISIFPDLYLASLFSDEPAKEISILIQKKAQLFKRGEFFRILMQTLQQLQIAGLTLEEKQFLLINSLKNKENRICLDQIKLLLTFISSRTMVSGLKDCLNDKSLSQQISLRELFESVFAQEFLKNFRLSVPENEVGNLYSKTFGTFQNPDYLFIYLKKLKSLPTEEADQLVSVFEEFVSHVLKGDFINYRYDKEQNLHLKQIFNGNENLENLWKNSISLSSPALKDFDIVDADHPWDLFCCGTGVASCQSVYDSPNYSKGLLSYLIDGQIRLLAIKNKLTGIIKARSMLRILINKENQSPALFMEGVYPSTASKEQVNALIELAKIKAEALGLPLYGLATGYDYERVTLESLDGRAPYQYTDSGGGILKKGKFQIITPPLSSRV